MTENPTPTPTLKVEVQTLAVGAAYRSASGDNWIKTGATDATNLTTGVHVTNVVGTEIVDPAPSATYTMFP